MRPKLEDYDINMLGNGDYLDKKTSASAFRGESTLA
jgi:hypothetical protein